MNRLAPRRTGRHRQGLSPLVLLGALSLAALPLLASTLTRTDSESGQPLLSPGVRLGSDLPRYGLNLGGSGTWGAEQLRANVLANPGLEPAIDGALFHVRSAQGTWVIEDASWGQRPENFWRGGRYAVRTGRDAGLEGQIVATRQAEGAPLALQLRPAPQHLERGDVIALGMEPPEPVLPRWWYSSDSLTADRDTRPGSPGRQSIKLIAGSGNPVEIRHYLDAIGDRAGRLLPVGDDWVLRLWARGAPGSTLTVHFDRAGRPPYLHRRVVLEADWQSLDFPIEAPDSELPGTLTLGLQASGGDVWLDDVYLGSTATGPGGFRTEAVATLQSLKPGYLRDWQGQLGDTLDNRFAGEFAHRPARYRGGENEIQYHYGIDDFLALCRAIDAHPWITAPTTLRDQEWRELGHQLRDYADRNGHEEIVVEFGNENWNRLFRPAGIPDALKHGEAIDRAFRLLREGSANDPRIVTVANAQFVNEHNVAAVAAATTRADRIAVAPYFLYELAAGQDVSQGVRSALTVGDERLRRESVRVARGGKRLAVYEVNFHTTRGSAEAALRDAVVAGAASGPALARRLMQATLAGVREQAVYSFSGFDNFTERGAGLVRLWGITRDLATPLRFRPSGLALRMLNTLATGEHRVMNCQGAGCEALTGLWFEDGKRLAVVSSAAETLSLHVRIPCSPDDTLNVELLDGSDPSKNNELEASVSTQQTTVSCAPGGVEVEVPAYSLLTLILSRTPSSNQGR